MPMTLQWRTFWVSPARLPSGIASSLVSVACGCRHGSDSMRSYRRDVPPQTFTPPAGVVKQCVSAANGLGTSGTDCDWMLPSEIPQQSGFVSGSGTWYRHIWHLARVRVIHKPSGYSMGKSGYLQGDTSTIYMVAPRVYSRGIPLRDTLARFWHV